MNILVVDDDDLSREAVVDFLANDLGFDVDESARGDDALEQVQAREYALVVSDVRMPGLHGVELLKRIKAGGRSRTAVVLMTGYGDMENVISALRAGAEDYLQKPLNIEELAVVIDRVRERIAPSNELPEAPASVDEATLRKLERTTLPSVPGFGRVGIFSEALRGVVNLAERLHSYRSVPVLIEGETGTGKELMARLVHYGPARTEEAPFISINCSTIPPALFESELFGYERGAFTGAAEPGKVGQLELADGGTLFLDEIGDLPLDLQPKFLRVLQQREVTRVGGVSSRDLDVRIVCATNRDLEEMMEMGSFRRDLYYRLNVGRIRIPPLRERPDDIIPLAQLLLERFAAKYGRLFRFIDEDARQALLAAQWRGNTRELVNAIERAVLLHDAVVLRADHLAIRNDAALVLPRAAPEIVLRRGQFELPPEGLDLDGLEQEIVRKALALMDGNKSKTAEYLGISRSALYTRLSKK